MLAVQLKELLESAVEVEPDFRFEFLVSFS